MFKKYTTHKNQEEKGVMLDWIQKITELARRENEPDAEDYEKSLQNQQCRHHRLAKDGAPNFVFLCGSSCYCFLPVFITSWLVPLSYVAAETRLYFRSVQVGLVVDK
jgi:hypothetical protein